MNTVIDEIEEESNSIQMEELLSQHEDLVRLPAVGDIVTGHILEKGRNAMFIDLDTLGVGVIYGRELFDDLDTFKSAKIGDPIQATVAELDNEEGYTELSLRTASRERSWEELRRKLEGGEVFETEILDANKGGLIVRVNGVTGFLPVSQLAPDHYPRVEGGDKNKILERLKNHVGDLFKVKIITAIQESDKLIVSEKSAIGDEMSDTLEKLGQGTIVEGTVSGIVDFGVFVKFDADSSDLEGLVHISELAWQRIDDPSDIVAVGEKVKAKVIGVDGLRISLSIKQLKEDPWKTVSEQYKVGDKVKGEILKVTPFGGFVKLSDDIHGLVHVSELPEKSQANPETVLEVGKTKQFTIISLEPEEHRLGLSLGHPKKKKDKEEEQDPVPETEKKTTKKKK